MKKKKTDCYPLCQLQYECLSSALPSSSINFKSSLHGHIFNYIDRYLLVVDALYKRNYTGVMCKYS